MGRHRLDSMNRFLSDYEVGKIEGRDLPEALPSLSFADSQFDLAVCSHLLFLYSDHLSLEFHEASIQDLCRVAKDVRIFPLLRLDGTRSPHVEVVQEYFSNDGYSVDICIVPYEFQRGGNQMIRIRRL